MAEKKINTVLYDVDQSSDTSDLQKATARANIGAQAELTAGENIEIDPETNTISSTSAPQVQADWDEIDTTSASYIQNKPSTFLNLLTEDGDMITSGANLNDYTTPKTYFIPSANDMKELTNTPYEQMSLANPQKTGQSHLYVFKTKTNDGRITQLLITPYSTDPADDNAFGIWYRQSSSESNLHWGTWHRVGEGGSGSGIVRYTGNSISQTWPNWDDMLTDLDADKDVILVVRGGTGLVLDYYVTEWSKYGVPFIQLVSSTKVMYVSKNTSTLVWTIEEHGLNADTVDGYHVSVGYVGTDSNTLYFV